MLQEFRDEMPKPDPILVFHFSDDESELVASAPTDYGLIHPKAFFLIRQHHKQGKRGSGGNLHVAVYSTAI
jgi:hypothetical protein